MSTQSAEPKPKTKAARVDLVDAMRGFAVIFMIFWHTVDGWLFDEARSLAIWDWLRLLGGLAAPLFHLLAGISMDLKSRADRSRGISFSVTRRGLVIRGLEVLTLAYALRFQMWAIDKGGFLNPSGMVFLVLGLAGIFGVVIGLSKLDRNVPRAWAFLAGGLASYAIGLVIVHVYTPSHVAGLLRIDVLHSLGASMVIVPLLAEPMKLFERPVLAFALGISVAAATPLLERIMPGPLPAAIAGYIAKWAPVGDERPATLFPLAPWLSFVFLGAALGPLMKRASSPDHSVRVMLALAGAGLVLAIALHPASPIGEAAARYAAIGAIDRVLYRTGLCLVVCALALPGARIGPLCEMGRASLPVYWLHLELAFGIAARPIKQSLGWIAWAVLFALLLLLMWGVARVYLGPYRRWIAARTGSA